MPDKNMIIGILSTHRKKHSINWEKRELKNLNFSLIDFLCIFSLEANHNLFSKVFCSEMYLFS